MPFSRLLSLLFLLSCISVFSQVPGYMGKKTVLGYGLNLSPALIGATPRDNRINTIHELYIEQAVSERWAIGFCSRFYTTVYDNRRILTDFKQAPESSYTINGSTFGLTFKHFRKNFVAPWGSYFLLSPVVNIATTHYDPYMHVKGKINEHDTLYVDFGPELQRYYHFDLMIGWGKTRIIADRVVIDYGFNVQLWSLMTILAEAGLTADPPLLQSNYIEYTHKDRVRGINRANLFLKLGYLF